MKEKPWWMTIAILLFELLVIIFLIPSHYSSSVIEAERKSMEDYLGPEPMQEVYSKAYHWHKATLMDTGILNGLYFYLIPTEEEKNAKGMQDLNTSFFDWMEGRLEALSNSVYHFYIRLAQITLWMPYIFIFGLACIFDGRTTWLIKRTNYDYPSPFLYIYSSKGVGFISIGALLLFMAPLNLHPLIVPVSLMVLLFVISIALGNLSKRI